MVPANRLYQRVVSPRRPPEGYYPDRTDKNQEGKFRVRRKAPPALVLRCETA